MTVLHRFSLTPRAIEKQMLPSARDAANTQNAMYRLLAISSGTRFIVERLAEEVKDTKLKHRVNNRFAGNPPPPG